MTYKKKLIEVSLPLNAINVAGAREKTIRHGHPSNLHRWWARRPFVCARAVIFAQMVDDPSSHPEIFVGEAAQEAERRRLFSIIEDLVKWENTNDETVLNTAREEIWKSWRYTCEENSNHPRAKELFNRNQLPGFHDPFAGGGAIPLEAQRLGLDSFATDLNPVPVLINKAMIEVPFLFASHAAINPTSQSQKKHMGKSWIGMQGISEDVNYYGEWIRNEAEKRLGDLYPKVKITERMASARPDLKRYVGRELTIIAWIWARTVKSPNPAFRNIDVPLATSFMLSAKKGKEAYVRPLIDKDGYSFVVETGIPKDIASIKAGTKLARGANFSCIMSGIPMDGDHIKLEGKAGRIGARLMAMVADGDRERVYLSPTREMEEAANSAYPEDVPEGSFVEDARAFTPCIYGYKEWKHLFTKRQLVTLTTFSDLIAEARTKISRDFAKSIGKEDERRAADSNSIGLSYSDAVCIYLSLIVSKTADSNNSFCPWEPVAQCTRQLFGRQAISMLWDFGEANPLHDSSGGLLTNINGSTKSFESFGLAKTGGHSLQVDASTQQISLDKVVSTDPPYYDNVPYADLSDFFYIWLRRSLRNVLPDLFTTLAVPKIEELVAFAYRHKNKGQAEEFFLNGMTQAMHRIAEQAHPAFPVTIYYAFKQSESGGEEGATNTGWDTFLAAVIEAGFAISGTWPMRTEMVAAMKAIKNSLASSIVLVCRKREALAPTATRREFVSALKAELPEALAHLQEGNIAPVDLAQAAIGPGMAVYTRYAKVLDAEGNPLTVRNALALINQTLDEALAEQEGDFDADSRWALTWFEQNGYAEGDYGSAEQLSKSKNTAVEGLVEAGILVSKSGKVRLLKSTELSADWEPDLDSRLTVWEMVHQLIRALEAGGEPAAAKLAKKLGGKADTARELCYRLYNLCERKKRASEAMAYNALVQSWPEITRLASEGLGATKPSTEDMFDEEQE